MSIGNAAAVYCQTRVQTPRPFPLHASDTRIRGYKALQVTALVLHGIFMTKRALLS